MDSHQCLLVYIRPPPCGEVLEDTLRAMEPWLKGDIPAGGDNDTAQGTMGKQLWELSQSTTSKAGALVRGHSVNRTRETRLAP